MSDRAGHWDNVYAGRRSEDLGWHQPSIATLDLVYEHTMPSSSVIDVGGGDSRLVDALVSRGHADITILDLSRVALDRGQARLGEAAAAVSWVEADVLTWTPPRTWDLWHDRAVFHFLTEAEDRRTYIAAAERAIAPGGILIVATFGPDGPETCAGLPVVRYGTDTLVAAFADGHEPLWAGELPPSQRTEGDQRAFVAAVFRRRSVSSATRQN